MDRIFSPTCPHVLREHCFIGRMVAGGFLDKISSYPGSQHSKLFLPLERYLQLGDKK